MMKDLWKFVLVLAVVLGFAAVSGCDNQSSGDDEQGAVAVQPADAAVPPPPATVGSPSASDASNDNQDFA